MEGSEKQPQDKDGTAVLIGQHLLDATGIALLAGSFAGFGPHFRIPTTVATPQGARQIETEDDLQQLFATMSAYYRAKGDIALDRRVQMALFDGPDRIRYDHISIIRRDGQIIDGPIISHSIAERRDGHWQVVSSQYVLDPGSVRAAAIVADGDSQAQSESPQGAHAALSIFQENLDAVNDAYLHEDFEVLQQRLMLPLFKQGTARSEVIADTAALREEFDGLTRSFRLHGVTDLVRTVKVAHFLGEDRIFGSYRTHVLAGTRLVVPSYISAVTLERDADGQWRMTSIMHPLNAQTIDRDTPFSH